MKFKKIVCVDKTRLQNWAIEELQNYSEQEIEKYNDYPECKKEILKRIGDAEVVMVSWHTQLDEEILQNCPNLKYIGMCCSLYDNKSANVAVEFARKNGITVKGISDYGDPGVVEFIISELVRLLHGFGDQQWKDEPEELTGKKVGIIGLGTTGQLLAECLLPFGVDLYYYSRTRKYDWEARGVTFLDLEKLLTGADIISIHLPRNIVILNEKEFELMGEDKILINTSLGLPFNLGAFENWINKENNFAIFDADGKNEIPNTLQSKHNFITGNKSAGWSRNTQERLSQKVIDNFRDLLRLPKAPGPEIGL